MTAARGGTRALELACPRCRRAPLPLVASDMLRCGSCGATYPRTEGIWRMLAEGRREAFRELVEQYETVRLGERRMAKDPGHLRALPFRDRSGERRYEWAIRARSFMALLEHVVEPLERAHRAPLRILDIGSGIGWLAYRLAKRGHAIAAIDLVTNDFDGLGTHHHYDHDFISIQAEFDRLPVGGQSADLVVYNAAFHYAADYLTSMREALRVLAPGGAIVIMDSPIYRDASSGQSMVGERDDAFERRYGFRVRGTEGFLTYDRLDMLKDELALRWELFEPWYGLRWWLKPWVARALRRREPARFKLVVGRRVGEPSVRTPSGVLERAAQGLQRAAPRSVRRVGSLLRRARRAVGRQSVAPRLTPESAYRLWSETYDQEADNVVLVVEEQVFHQLLERAPVAGKTVVDIGCGTGRHWRRLLDMGPMHLYGFDSSPEMLARLSARHPGASVHVRAGTRLELGDEGVDLIVSTLALSYARDVRDELREWTRLLKVGGEIVLTDLHPAAARAGVKRTFSHRGTTFEIAHESHDVEALHAMFRGLHLEILRVEERALDPALRGIFERNGYIDGYRRVEGVPIVLGLHLRRMA